MNSSKETITYLGGFIIWLIKGRKSNLKEEVSTLGDNNKFYRNLFVGLGTVFLFLFILHFIFQTLK